MNIANTTSTPYSYRDEEGEGLVGSHKVVGKGYVITENSQVVSIDAILNSTYHTKHDQTHQPVVW